MKKENLIQKRSFAFALQIIELYMQLQQKREYVLSKLLLSAGTSIGANVEEAKAAQSKRGFVSKMSIASKEAREVRYWLRLYKKSKRVDIDLDSFLDEANHIVDILTKILNRKELIRHLITHHSSFKICPWINR